MGLIRGFNIGLNIAFNIEFNIGFNIVFNIGSNIGFNIGFNNIRAQYWTQCCVQYQDSISGSILGSISVLDVAMNLCLKFH